MAKTAIITAEIEPELKARVEAVLKKMGLSVSDAFTLFLNRLERQGELPMETHVPNRKTRRIMRNTDRGKNLVRYSNEDEFFRDLGI